MKAIMAITALSLLAGCSVNQAIVADSVTTYAGIKHSNAEESNSILPSSAAGAAIGSAALKVGMLQVAKRYAPRICKPMAKMVYASSIGAATNNLGVIGDAKNSTSVVTGVGAGVFAFKYNGNNAASKYCGRK